jgi:hypothetical protein
MAGRGHNNSRPYQNQVAGPAEDEAPGFIAENLRGVNRRNHFGERVKLVDCEFIEDTHVPIVLRKNKHKHTRDESWTYLMRDIVLGSIEVIINVDDGYCKQTVYAAYDSFGEHLGSREDFEEVKELIIRHYREGVEDYRKLQEEFRKKNGQPV